MIEQRFKPRHPSNVLYNGEAEGFRHAMHLVKRECAMERGAGVGDPELDAKLNKSLNAYEAAANYCLFEYDRVVRTVERELFERFCRHEDEDVRRIGKCAIDGDYSDLAI
jgi:hypothetical protein